MAAPAATTTTTAPTTTTTVAPLPPPNEELGLASWYGAVPGTCASPFLSFGIVVTVTDLATGDAVSCTVDDREGAGYPRVVDMSPEGFSQIADLGQGVVDVTISW